MGLLSLSVIEKVRFIGEEVKGYTCKYFKMIKENINLAFHTWIIIECIAVKVAKFRDVLL